MKQLAEDLFCGLVLTVFFLISTVWNLIRFKPSYVCEDWADYSANIRLRVWR